MPHPSLDPVAQRPRLVAWALSLTANTALAPGRYERQLLARYEQGELTIDQVLDLLDAATYQLLYRSHATTAPTPADLQHLLDQARAHNAGAQLTGLLVYRDGRYVQLLEGPQHEVRALYACILRDPRHTRVVTLSEGLEPARLFPSWRMGLANAAQPAVTRLLDAALAHAPSPGHPLND
ncbi:BLUF domain-containing protein [Hymenobacter sp. B1770]|uniref:BLUF domain-containing protein n=1 Tax=Hymenobacter sp. B1770 TaxID=1718788 RepID=UPI003CEAF7BA